jgi:hypothetical protein
MKLISILLQVLIITSFLFAQQNTVDARSQRPQTTTALQSPYTFILPVTVTSNTNYVVPDSDYVCLLRTKYAGTICVSTPYSDSVFIYCTSYDVYPDFITKIFGATTTDTLRSNCITLHGIRKK